MQGNVDTITRKNIPSIFKGIPSGIENPKSRLGTGYGKNRLTTKWR